MKLKDFIEGVKEDGIDEFNLCLSRIFVVKVDPEAGEQNLGKKEDFTVVLDIPIIGYVINPDDNEIRFVLEGDKAELEETLNKKIELFAKDE